MTLIDADNRAHAPEYSLPRQIASVRKRSAELETEGSAMFGYELPLSAKDVIRERGS